MSRPTTELGHLYVKLAGQLRLRRVLKHLAPLTQAEEAEMAAQMDALWQRMDVAEQARVESQLTRD